MGLSHASPQPRPPPQQRHHHQPQPRPQVLAASVSGMPTLGSLAMTSNMQWWNHQMIAVICAPAQPVVSQLSLHLKMGTCAT